MLIFLRSLIFTLGQWPFTIVFSTLALLTWPLPPLLRYRIISLWARTMLHWLRLTCGIRYEVSGLENVPQTPGIILSKHQSAWETLAFQKIFPPQVWVLKRELLWIPFFGWALALTSPIAINRSAGREALKQMLSQGMDRLSKGFWIVIFPEGTRTAPGARGKYHIGGAWLATHSQSSVLPVAHNAGEHWPKNGFLKKPGTIQVVIGKPISSNDLQADALNQQVADWIENTVQQLQNKPTT